MNFPSNERRSSARFNLDLALKYTIYRGKEAVSQGRGRTLDLSSGGILLTSEAELAPGRIELSIAWPVSLEDGPPLQLRVNGKVLRNERNVAAVEIQHYEFRTRASALA